MENPDQNNPALSENAGEGTPSTATPPVEKDASKAPTKTTTKAKVPARGKSGSKAKPSATPKVSAKPKPTKSKPSGPPCKMEVRYQGKTYAPGENLPGDLDDETLTELEALDAI